MQPPIAPSTPGWAMCPATAPATPPERHPIAIAGVLSPIPEPKASNPATATRTFISYLLCRAHHSNAVSGVPIPWLLSATTSVHMRSAIRIPSHVEEGLRSILLAFSLLVAVCSVALADPIVAGDWRADLGQGVRIDMNVTPDGNWSSETIEGNRLVRKMRGTYQQSQSGVR